MLGSHMSHVVGSATVGDCCHDAVAHYKIPRYIRFVEAYPRTVSGKIWECPIRQAMIEELGSGRDDSA